MILALWLVAQDYAPVSEAIRQALFTTISVVTGTGYATVDYGAWGTFATVYLFFLMCVGGCTGSTTGGIKVFRFVVLYAVARVQVLRLLQPNGVFRAMYNDRPISDATAISVLAFLFAFAASFAVLAVLLALLGLDYLTAMSAALTALANVGPGLGEIVGPAGNFSPLPETAKWLLALGMLLGRLELFTVLVLLLPAFWRA
jgi:trk system potassium uptake protein TrkH